MELAHRGWKVDYVAVRHGLGMRIPHPEGFDHPNLLIVLGAATLGTTRLIDNVDVIPKEGGGFPKTAQSALNTSLDMDHDGLDSWASCIG